MNDETPHLYPDPALHSPLASPRRERRSFRVAVAAAVVFLSGGVGGFAVGHAAGNDGPAPAGFHDGPSANGQDT